MLGRVIANRYTLIESLGKGGFGEVFKAQDSLNPNPVAIKVLLPEFELDQIALQNFKIEVGRQTSLNHPHILRVLGFDFDINSPYIVMELAEGGSLAQKLDAPLPMQQILIYFEQLASALDYIHVEGLIHRDIKPLNILLGRANNILLSDFGLTVTSSKSRLLKPIQEVFGTPEYVAPEAWGGKVGISSDIYALGIVLFQMITGQTPYQGDNYSLEQQHLQAEIPMLAEKTQGLQYPPALDKVIARALAKEPQQRPTTAGIFFQWLKAAWGNNSFPPPMPMPGSSLPLHSEKRPIRSSFEAQIEHLLNQLFQAKLLTDWDNMIKIGEGILQFDASQPEALLETANAYKVRAADLFERVVRTKYVNPGWYLKLLDDFSQAIQLAPSEAEYYYWRGRVNSRLENQEKAYDDFRRGFMLNPGKIEKFLDTVHECNMAIVLDPTKILFYSRQATLYEQEYFYWMYNNPTAYSYRNAGDILASRIALAERAFTFALGGYTKVIELLNYASNLTEAERNPSLEYYFLKRAELHERKNFLSKLVIPYFPTAKDNILAIADYDQAIRLNPNKGEYYFRRGLAYERLRKHDEAARHLAEAYRLGYLEAWNTKKKYWFE